MSKNKALVGKPIVCNFFCSDDSHSLDPVFLALDKNSTELIQWGRNFGERLADGLLWPWSTTNGCFCERTYMAKFYHTHRDRKQFQKQLSRDLHLRQEFKNARS